MEIALLAPVPCVHLPSAIAVCKKRGKVAFGSRCWDLFNDIDLEYGSDLPVLIYASVGDRKFTDFHVPGRATLKARLLGHKIAAPGGVHPDPTCRPPTTLEMDTPNWWFCFWEVSELEPLKKPDQVPLGKLKTLAGKTPISLVPEGPRLVWAPATA